MGPAIEDTKGWFETETVGAVAKRPARALATEALPHMMTSCVAVLAVLAHRTMADTLTAASPEGSASAPAVVERYEPPAKAIAAFGVLRRSVVKETPDLRPEKMFVPSPAAPVW